MKTVNYIKTSDNKNMKTIREYQEKLAKMVSDTLGKFAEVEGFNENTYHHIWVEKYLLADITVEGYYERNTDKMSFDAKVSWSDVTKSYRIEIRYHNNVFVANVSMEEAESIKETNRYTSYNRQSGLVKEFGVAVNGWLTTL